MKLFWLALALALAMIADGESTFRGVHKFGLDELNPITRPLVHAGRVPFYLYEACVHLFVVMFVRYQVRLRRRHWYKLLYYLIAAHVAASIWNVYVTL